MVQDLHLTYSLLLCIVAVYVLLSLLLAVIVGRFISFGKGLDHGRAFAVHPFMSLSSPGSSRNSGLSRPSGEGSGRF